MASTPKSNRTTQLLLWGAVLAVLLLALYAIRALTREHISVVATQVSYRDLVKTSSTNGKVEPVDDFEAHAQVAGQVQDIYVNVGDKVHAGQLLLKMDDADALARLASANSALRAAELAVSDIERGGSQDERNTYASDEKRAKLQRDQDAASLAALQQLQQKGAASPAEIDAATVRLQLDDNMLHTIQQHSTQRYSDADRARAKAQLADALAAVAAANRDYASVDIHSKISGTVYYLPVSQYDYVSLDNNDLVYVADLKHLRITAYFDEPEIGNLAAGQPVKIAWEAKPGIAWHGHITQAPTTIISYGTRNVGECFIDVDDADGVLQPNANVTVTVTTEQHPHVLSVPREALHEEGSQPYVFRIIHNKLVRTPVQLGSSARPAIVNLTQAEITGGLAEGDTVALNATTNRELSNGLEVTPVYR
ncbi:MAG: efflux RND transporter periplasmic adaptor subunit [Acidobacteriaceae bacterium]